MKVFFETLGCPKNFNDTQAAKGVLMKAGYDIAETAEASDVIVVNTCGFINDAKKESIETIFDMAEYRGAGKKLVVSGCLSERYSDELYEEIPEVDCFIGVNEYDRLPEIISEICSEKVSGEILRRKIVSGCYEKVLSTPERVLGENPYTATLKIAEGCDNCCAYCIIPKIRGGFRSKPMEAVIAEAEALVSAGCKELILIAQDVTNYGRDLYGEPMLAELVRKICRVEGIQWVRLMYCYEDRITDRLIEVMATEPKVCHYIDIPIQHASDSVLKAMRRRSTEGSIKNTIERLRKAIPDIHIRTTLIVGFPGETEDDFDRLLDFVEETRFARLGVFAYSQEENTEAGEMDNQIDEEVKQERLDTIMRRQLDISMDYNREKVGKTLTVLVEEKDVDGSYIGRTEYDAPEIDNSVIFTSHRDLKAGDMVQVLVEDAFDYDLVGREV